MDKKGFYNRGLTLLEILIASLLLCMFMVGLMGVFIGSKRYLISSRSQMAAGELGRYFLGNLSMQVKQSEWGNNCLSNSTYCTPQNITLGNINYNATYNTTEVFGLRKARVNITWEEPTS